MTYQFEPTWPDIDLNSLPPAVGVEQTCKRCGIVLAVSDENGVIPAVTHDCATGEVWPGAGFEWRDGSWWTVPSKPERVWFGPDGTVMYEHPW